MALKQLILSRKLAAKRADLETAKTRLNELKEKRSALKKREEELEAAVSETDETTAEDVQKELDQAVAEFEAEVAQVEADQAEAEQQVTDLEAEVDTLQAELDELNRKVEEAVGPAEPEENEDQDEEARSERKGKPIMNKRSVFGTAQQRAAIFAREDVKQFAQRVRDMIREKRTVSGADLLIPEVMLPMIKEEVEQNSQLLPYMNYKSIKGTAKQNVMGTVPEAVWTDMLGKINEIDLSFNQVKVDGYKAAAFIALYNSILEDNDQNLMEEVVIALGVAIAMALDKAILYGVGNGRMPLGIVTRLCQTAQPNDYPAVARPWANVKSTNVKSISAANSTGIKLFQSIMEVFGAAKHKYGKGGKFWAMNEATHLKLLAEALNFNANGALVAGMENTMPVIGGDIVELDFIPANIIVAGYGDLYLLVQRSGVAIEASEHARFLEDQTLVRGKARYDGTPVIAEGFVAFGINGATVAADAVTFAEDTANADPGSNP